MLTQYIYIYIYTPWYVYDTKLSITSLPYMQQIIEPSLLTLNQKSLPF